MSTYIQQFVNDSDGYDASANTNSHVSDDSSLWVGSPAVGGYRAHSWITWSLPTPPFSAGTILNSAVISLYIFQNNANGANYFSVYRCKRNWSESQIWWSEYSSGNAWQTAGGIGANDIDTTALAQSTLVAQYPTQGTEYTATFSAYGLQELHKMFDGTYPNYGFLFQQDSEGGAQDQHNWCGSGHGTQGYHPKITITYTLPLVARSSWFF